MVRYRGTIWGYGGTVRGYARGIRWCGTGGTVVHWLCFFAELVVFFAKLVVFFAKLVAFFRNSLCFLGTVRWYGTGGTVVRYEGCAGTVGGYGGTVRGVRWYGTRGTLVRFGGYGGTVHGVRLSHHRTTGTRTVPPYPCTAPTVPLHPHPHRHPCCTHASPFRRKAINHGL